MPTTIGNHSVAAFANPSNGETLDATIVKGNDNTLRSAYVEHDTDPGIHVQSSTLASRPSAGTQGRFWVTQDSTDVYLWYDTGSAWVEVSYIRQGTSTTVGALTSTTGITVTTGGITVSGGGAAVTGNSSVTGDLNVTGTITGGTIIVPAAGVQAGTFASGNFVFQGNVTADSGEVKSRTLRATRQTQSGSGGTANFANGSHVRHTMTGNGTITLSGGVVGGVYTVEVLQDATGGRTVAWSGATWAGGVVPTSTTTANRKDVFTFFFDGTAYLGVQFGANFASTA
jgi:hypothetical protein